mmetsp:Transcript_36262/g.43781  ORF Transcript_36262/g.43781 Transcript_36262/m.43781 type:complete len:304 (+) Transcript_36262:1496-2407(+)
MNCDVDCLWVPWVHRIVGTASEEILFTWAPVDELNYRMIKSLHTSPVLSTPDGNTLSMHSGEKASSGRPLDIAFSPEFAPIYIFCLVLRCVVPVDFSCIPITDDKLVSSSLVGHPLLQVLPWLVLCDFAWNVGFWNFLISVEVVKLVHREDMALVQLISVRLLHSSVRLLWGTELDESVSLSLVGFLIDRHPQASFTDCRNLSIDFLDNVHQLFVLLRRDYWQVVYYDHTAKTGVRLDFFHLILFILAEDTHILAFWKNNIFPSYPIKPAFPSPGIQWDLYICHLLVLRVSQRILERGFDYSD